MTDPWNPDQYAKFAREREQPFFDLMAMLRPARAMRVVDLGCGTGKLTRLLHAQLQAQDTLGIDRSPRMLERHDAEPLPSGLRFEMRDIEAFPAGGEQFDVVFSNAALQWVDDHDALIPRLATAVAPGGQMAVQVPAMHDDASHTVADALIQEEPFRSAAQGWRRSQPVLRPEEYARLLFDNGFADPAVRLIVYPHVLPATDDVVEWMKGTLLAEYSRHLPAALFGRFLDEYRQRLTTSIGTARPYFFPFKRILMWGHRA
ncbi:MAG TPA: methyltransferase domain-containing protein [Rhodanobacteraceae bacterium]